MNLTNGKGSMSVAAGSGPWKSGDFVSDQFPAGLRVLVVDDDPTCLMILERMLKQCLYEVTKCNRAENALAILREKKNGFDIVLSDVHMPDMDGFKLLEHIGLEMDLPVIMMSADDGKNVVMKGVTHGACDYLIKPIRIEALKNIWQHVVRKRKNEWKELEQSGSIEDGDRQQKPQDDVDYSSSVNEGNWKSAKRRKEEEEEAEERDDTSTLKKPRVVWSVELHQQFVAAVNQLGIDKAVPKKILELMNVPGLTRENVASHLQKYRLYLRRISGVAQHQGGVNGSFIGTQDAAFGQMSSFNGLDLQTLAVAGQLPAQSLATLQAAGFGRAANKPGIPIPIIDQRNVFSFDNPKLRFGEGQQQQIIGSNKQVNLLHGIPTTVEPKQLVNLQQSAQSFANTSMQVHSQAAQSNSLLMHMAQPQSRGQILSDNTGSHISRLPMNVGQPFLSNDIAGAVLSRNGTSENGRGTAYNVSQPSSTSNLALNHSTELPTGSFPLRNAPALTSFTSKGGFHDNINHNMKGSGAFMPSYDILGDLQQLRSHGWELPNVGLAFDASQHASNVQGNLDPSPSTVHSGFSSSQSSGQNRNPSAAGKPVYLPEGSQQGNMPNDGQQLNSPICNPLRIKSEALPDPSYPSILYPEHTNQEDLMSVLLKQQQQGVGSANTEFDFDGFPLEGIPD